MVMHPMVESVKNQKLNKQKMIFDLPNTLRSLSPQCDTDTFFKAGELLFATPDTKSPLPMPRFPPEKKALLGDY